MPQYHKTDRRSRLENRWKSLEEERKNYGSFSEKIDGLADQLVSDTEQMGADEAVERLGGLLEKWKKRDADFKAFGTQLDDKPYIHQQNRYKELPKPEQGFNTTRMTASGDSPTNEFYPQGQIQQEPRSREADPFTKGFMGTIVPGGQALAQAYSKPIDYSQPPAETSTGSDLGDTALETVGSLAGSLPTFIGAGSVVGASKIVQSIKNPIAQKILAGTLTFPLANAPRNIAEVGTGQKSIGKGLLTTAEEAGFGALFGMLPTGKLLDKKGTYITKNLLGTIGAGALGYGMGKVEGAEDQDALVNAGILAIMHASGAIKPQSKLYDEVFDPAFNKNVGRLTQLVDKKVLNSLRPGENRVLDRYKFNVKENPTEPVKGLTNETKDVFNKTTKPLETVAKKQVVQKEAVTENLKTQENLEAKIDRRQDKRIDVNLDKDVKVVEGGKSPRKEQPVPKARAKETSNPKEMGGKPKDIESEPVEINEVSTTEANKLVKGERKRVIDEKLKIDSEKGAFEDIEGKRYYGKNHAEALENARKDLYPELKFDEFADKIFNNRESKNIKGVSKNTEARVNEIKEKKEKKPYEMTKDEYIETQKDIDTYPVKDELWVRNKEAEHRRLVKEAAKGELVKGEGYSASQWVSKDIPKEVLKDYPDIKLNKPTKSKPLDKPKVETKNTTIKSNIKDLKGQKKFLQEEFGLIESELKTSGKDALGRDVEIEINGFKMKINDPTLETIQELQKRVRSLDRKYIYRPRQPIINPKGKIDTKAVEEARFGIGIGIGDLKQLKPSEIAKTLRENGQVLKDFATVGADFIAKGAKDFKSWSSKMIKEFSDKIKPHLLKIWDSIKKEFGKQLIKLDQKNPFSLNKQIMQGKMFEPDNPLVKRLNQEVTKTAEKTPEKPTKVPMTDKRLLNEKMKKFKEGYRKGFYDKEDIQKAVYDYAKNLPVSEIRRSQIKPLLNEMRKARTPENIESIIDRIDKIANTVGREKVYGSITNKITKAKAKAKDGKLKGRINAEEQDVVNNISKAIKLNRSQADLVLRDLESKLANSPPEQIERIMGKLSIYDQFSNLKGKSLTELKKLDEAVDYLIESGRGKLKEKKAERKARFDELREYTENSVGKAKSQFEEKTFFGELSKKVNTHRLNKSWEHIIETLSPKGKGEKAYTGKLHDELTKPVNEATWGENYSRQEMITKAEKNLEKIYGSKSKWREAERPKDTGIEIDGVSMKLSQGEAGNLWALWQDVTNRPVLEKMGFTEQSINKLYDKFITPETKKLVSWVRSEYQRLHPEYDKVYREIYNTPLGYSDTYVPRSRELFKGKDVDVLDRLGEHGSVANQHIFRRVDSKADFNIKGQDIYSNYIKYVTEMEHFKHWSPVVRDLKSVFNSTEVRSSISGKYGNNMLQAIDSFIDRFAKGGTSKGADYEIFNKMRRQYNRAVLNLNPVLVPKQLASTIGYASDIPVASFTKGLAEFWLNPVGNAKLLMSHPLMKSRYKLGFTRDMIDILNKSQSKMLKGHKSLMNQMMIFTKLGDAGAIIQGGYPVYKYHYNKLIKSGMDKIKAQEKALYEFAKATDRMQQAGNIKDLSHFESAGSIAKLFTMYKKSPFQYFNASETAFRNLIKGRGSKADAIKKLFISHFALPMVFQWVSDGFQINDKNQLRAAVLGSFNGLAITGGILSSAWTAASSGGNLQQITWAMGEQAPAISMGVKLGTGMIDAVKMFGEEIGSDDFWEYAHGAARDLSYYAGLPYIPVSRQYSNVKKIVEGEAKYPVRMGMGYSDKGLDMASSKANESSTTRSTSTSTTRSTSTSTWSSRD